MTRVPVLYATKLVVAGSVLAEWGDESSSASESSTRAAKGRFTCPWLTTSDVTANQPTRH
jgi:hypothetical protein